MSDPILATAPIIAPGAIHGPFLSPSTAHTLACRLRYHHGTVCHVGTDASGGHIVVVDEDTSERDWS